MPWRLLIVSVVLWPGLVAAQPCNQRTLDMFDLSRRARNILVEINRSDRQYDEAIVLYEQALPSEPGYLGVALQQHYSDLGDFGVCTADGTQSLQLARTRTGLRSRWVSADETALFELTYLNSSQTLSRIDSRLQTNAQGVPQRTVTATSYLEDEQRYFGARLRLNAWVDLTLGLLDVQGIRVGEAGAQLPARASNTGWRVYTRAMIPALNGASAEFVFGGPLDRPESALLNLPLRLPYDWSLITQLAWLGDESRAALRASVTDPWEIATADVGLETSGVVFRHARLQARYLTDPLIRLPGRLLPALALPKGGSAVPFLSRVSNFYIRLGLDAEVSRFSGQHFEDVTGRSGVTGFASRATLVFHMIGIPARAQLRIGGGRNRVDLLEHAAAFVDRGEFISDITLSLGW